jgi:hypothetical protein
MFVMRRPLHFCKASLYVHLTIMQSSNGQLLRQPSCPKPKRHNAKLCPFAIRQRIINALANGDSQRAIARALHVSNNTVAAIREQEWQQVAARKERIAAQCELNATLAAERMTDKLQGTDDIPLNTLVPALGVSVDKLAVLRGHAPSVNIANIWMPSEAEKEERRAAHKRLDEIARRLREAQGTDAGV